MSLTVVSGFFFTALRIHHSISGFFLFQDFPNCCT
uniref:Uncharacterized protein n=1 Tax=Anguilla anguilla TaxID=7936 RepID=A0A0E9WIZ6_ANGAN